MWSPVRHKNSRERRSFCSHTTHNPRPTFGYNEIDNETDDAPVKWTYMKPTFKPPIYATKIIRRNVHTLGIDFDASYTLYTIEGGS